MPRREEASEAATPSEKMTYPQPFFASSAIDTATVADERQPEAETSDTPGDPFVLLPLVWLNTGFDVLVGWGGCWGGGSVDGRGGTCLASWGYSACCWPWEC